MTSTDKSARSESAEQLIKAARRLFAEHGIDGVTVREIADAAGQKNHGAVGYHFGSKEALVRAIVLDGAMAMDAKRNKVLDELEAQGGPRTVREIVDLITDTSVDVHGGAKSDQSYIRFILMLNMTQPHMFDEAIEDRWNSGYQRCFAHLRRLMPDMPRAIKNQRLLFMGSGLRSILALRERALSDTSRPHPMWNSPATLDHLNQLLTAMLEAPHIVVKKRRSGAPGAKAIGDGL